MKNDVVYSNERAEKILEILRTQSSVSVSYLADYFNVSGTTIRMDLTKLENKGSIIRTHGGAMLKTSLGREELITERSNTEQKSLIAMKALDFVNEGDTILIDTGTTMFSFAQALAESSISTLRVFTNDIKIAWILEEKKQFDIHLLGGKIRNNFHYCYGSQIAEELKKYNFEKLFITTAAISTSSGLTIANEELAQVKTAMIKASKNIILLADSSKINRIYFCKFADLSEIDVLIMNSLTDNQYEQKLEEFISKIIFV